MTSMLYLSIAPLYVSYRLFWANRMPIMDCDEVYNYWEPLHFLLYGSGMQTWEYAPDYALRTYAYLEPLSWICPYLVKIFHNFAPLLTSHPVTNDKLAAFVVLRAFLAGLSACSELLFLSALSEEVPFSESLSRQQLTTSTVSWIAAVVLLTSAGMTHAAGAYLPSSSVMILWMLCASAYIRRQFRLFCAIAVIATLCLGWPFGVAVFVPMGIDILRLHRRPLVLLVQVALWASMVQACVMWIDRQHYGKWISPTLNIFQYNAQGGGDELYGVEPLSYYVKNLALNLNYVAFVGLAFLPAAILLRLLGRPLPTSLVVVLSSIYMWLTLVAPRPHKEERFLFPIYPALVVASAVVMEQLWYIACRFSGYEKALRRSWWVLLLLPSCLISLSRSAALSQYYTAPTHIYAALPHQQRGTQIVCTCGEWYRFPSSFYLPSQYELGFLPSSFTGQLPKSFEAEGSRAGTNFNDRNRREMDRYVEVETCDYIVELETSKEAECLSYLTDEWTLLKQWPYLDAASTSTLDRILYLPYLHKATYVQYSLFAKLKGTNQ